MKCNQWAWIFLIMTLTAFLTGCDKNEPESAHVPASLPSATVSAAQVTKQKAAHQVAVVGTVQAVERAEISSKITGNIISLPVDLGSKVQQGELLVHLRAGEIAAQGQQAKAQLEQAQRNLAREENLLKKNAATPQMVKSLRDSTKIAEAAYKEALTMLDYARITAPFSGIVTKKISNIGDLATPGKPLLYLEEENNFQVITDIPEAMLLRIHKDDRLPVFIPSVDLSIEGTVAEVSPVADPSSRSAPIKLRIASDPRLRSGQFARVTLTMDEAETLMVPTPAVIPFGQMERVFVVQEQTARLRLVRTGSPGDGHIEILSGLSEGEKIITAGHENLLDGQPVVIQ
ncbi:efflux RND transporter periplasmic adaptor subunit [Desulfocastanea catecholica]